jgi:transketolase
MDTTELARRIRLHVLRMTNRAGSSHVGSVFACADILAVLYGSILQYDPGNPAWPARDRFLLSKGHAGSGVYATLAECGFFPLQKLETHFQDGSDLCGHVSHKGIPGVELSTGSLGHGLSIGAGMAYAARLDGRAYRVFVLLSDGECDEGATWEGALFAGHHQLDNLVAIVDYNKIQCLDFVKDVLDLEPFASKWASFRWAVREVAGHDHEALGRILSEVPFEPGRPSCVIAHTVKGKGVSFMENTILWHYRTAKGAEFEAALAELGGGK